MLLYQKPMHLCRVRYTKREGNFLSCYRNDKIVAGVTTETENGVQSHKLYENKVSLRGFRITQFIISNVTSLGDEL